MKVKTGGQDLEVGLRNIPFAEKMFGEKNVETFTKKLVSADKLRAVGDKTVAPHFNKLTTKIRSSKALEGFNKYSDISKMAEKDPIMASSILKFENMLKGFDDLNIDRDMKVYDMADFLTDLSDSEQKDIN